MTDSAIWARDGKVKKMTDLINGRTAEEIKRNLSYLVRCENCPQNHEYGCDYDKQTEGCRTVNDALALIEHLEAKVPRWISVEERLPEKDGEYLVLKVHNYCKNDGYMAQGVALFLRTRDPEWVIGNLCEVTHWMPLPDLEEM